MKDTAKLPSGPGWAGVAAASAFMLLGLLPACSDDSSANSAGAGGNDSSVGGGGASAGQGTGGAPTFAPPNPLAAPLVEGLTRALSEGEEAELRAQLGPTAFYVDARGRSEVPEAPAALLAGGPWLLESKVDSHHDVFRVKVRRGDEESVLFGAVDADGRASWLALAAQPPTDPASASAVVRAYQAAWNEREPAARAALIEQSWTDGARYVDPTADELGRRGLDATIAQFQASVAGDIVPASGAIEAHGLVHFRWRLEGGSAASLDGMDVGFVDATSALTLIAGFFGPFSPP
ncbi:hypothetical protein [Sorangium sp. So ce131]|uniref:hypothetical protein n=1 Tax=Sorangium sp. So ce131 TaxID=3133282 RepID=UPI003F5DAB8F